jgi:hypothetical protein
MNGLAIGTELSHRKIKDGIVVLRAAEVRVWYIASGPSPTRPQYGTIYQNSLGVSFPNYLSTLGVMLISGAGYWIGLGKGRVTRLL